MGDIEEAIAEALASQGDDTSTTSSTSSSPATSTGPSLAQARALERLRASFQEILRRWGFRPDKNLMNLMEQGVRRMWSTTQFMDQLRHTPEYRKQFKGITWRTGMTEGQYLSAYAQYKARAADIGEKITKKEFGKLLKRGVDFNEFSDRVNAIQSIDQYSPLWKQFQFELEAAGVRAPGGDLTKKELADFVMGLGSKKWETIWQRAFLISSLERVAGIEVVEPRKGEEATPDSYSLMRKDVLQILRQVEALNPGRDLEKELASRDFAALGQKLRSFGMQYLQRYGLETKDIVTMELGGPNAAKIAEKAERILKEQEAFFEPRAVSQAATQRLQGAEFEEQLPQSL